jgi:LacI family transcriptional regulator
LNRQDILIPTDYDLVVFSIGTAEQMREHFNSMSKFKFVSGMIILSMGVTDEDVKRFAKWETPVVLLDNHHPELSCVTIDDVGGGYKATKHLIELGHEKIAFVGGQLTNDFRFTSDAERYEGYRMALSESNISLNPTYHIQTAVDYDSGFQAAQTLFDLPSPPTGIFAANDIVAFGLIDGARDCGRQVPQDVSIIGHDDNPLAKYYQCTTISQNFYESGKIAASILLRILTGDIVEKHREILSGDLIIRSSSKSPTTT